MNHEIIYEDTDIPCPFDLTLKCPVFRELHRPLFDGRKDEAIKILDDLRATMTKLLEKKNENYKAEQLI